jgi:hypothetical protein
MSEIEGRLYEVLTLVESNQAAVQVTLDGLKAERIALRQERTALALQVTDLQTQVKAAVATAVKENLAGASGKVVDEVKTKTEALEHNVGVMTNSVADAEFALERIIKWASWRFLGLVVAILVVLGGGGWVASTGLQWWDEQAIASAQTEKDQLQQDIANLQANKAVWVQAGMLDKIMRCGPDNRPCVEVDENAGPFGYPGGPQDLRVLQGY